MTVALFPEGLLILLFMFLILFSLNSFQNSLAKLGLRLRLENEIENS